MPEIDDILKQRELTYGSFATLAEVSVVLRTILLTHYTRTHNKQPLPPHMTESITQICHKLARIVNGTPSYIESWRDIAGYSQLVVDILTITEGATDSKVVRQTVVNGKLEDTTSTKD